MKALTLPIVLTAETLRMALAGLTKVGGRSSLPILNTVRITRSNGTVRLEVTDLDQWLCYAHELEQPPITKLARQLAAMRWAREGIEGTCVPMASLKEALKAAGKSPVTITAKHLSYEVAGQILCIEYTPFDYKEWPETRAVKSDKPTVVFGQASKQAILEAAQFSSEDSTRFVLNGVYVESRWNDRPCDPVVVSTDGTWLYTRPIPLGLPHNINIPNNTLRVMAQPSIAAHEWRVIVHEDNDSVNEYAAVEAGPWRLVTKLVVGVFPNYRQVIPDVEPSCATVTFTDVQHSQLLEILRRLPPVGKYHTVELEFHGTGLTLVDQSSGISAFVQGVCSTRPVTTWVNRTRLTDALGIGHCAMHLTDAMSPILFKPGNGTIVLMPIRGERPDHVPDGPRTVAARDWEGKTVLLDNEDPAQVGVVKRIARTSDGLIAHVEGPKSKVELPVAMLQLAPAEAGELVAA